MEVGVQALQTKDRRTHISRCIYSTIQNGDWRILFKKTCRHRQVQLVLFVSGHNFVSPAPMFRCYPCLLFPTLERKEVSFIWTSPRTVTCFLYLSELGTSRCLAMWTEWLQRVRAKTNDWLVGFAPTLELKEFNDSCSLSSHLAKDLEGRVTEELECMVQPQKSIIIQKVRR